jgi:spore germination protein
LSRRRRYSRKRKLRLSYGAIGGTVGVIILAFCIMLLLRGAAFPVEGEPELSPLPLPTVALVERPADTKEDWRKNLQQPVEEPVVMAWAYQPKTLESVPKGVNVLCPTWFYLEEGEEGQVVFHTLADMGKTTWDPLQYVTTAHDGGARVWGTVVSFTPELSRQVVEESEKQEEFIRACCSWVRNYNLDGISFDFEKMDPENKVLFTSLVGAVKEALPASCTVSVAVTVPLDYDAPTNWWQCYDRGGLAKSCDYIAVMAYDSSSGYAEPTAAISWTEGRIRKLMEEVPSNQILLGVPFYGIDYQGERIQGELFRIHPTWKSQNSAKKTIIPRQVSTLLTENKVAVAGTEYVVDTWINKGTWNAELGCVTICFVDSEDVSHTWWCEDTRSIYQKGLLTGKYCLGGVAVWQFAFGNESLWNALVKGVKG